MSIWCTGGGHDSDAGEEATPLPVASTGGMWARLRPEGVLVSPVRQHCSMRDRNRGFAGKNTPKIRGCDMVYVLFMITIFAAGHQQEEKAVKHLCFVMNSF